MAAPGLATILGLSGSPVNSSTQSADRTQALGIPGPLPPNCESIPIPAIVSLICSCQGVGLPHSHLMLRVIAIIMSRSLRQGAAKWALLTILHSASYPHEDRESRINPK